MIKLLLCNLQVVWSETAWVSCHRWSCCLNVVSDIMVNRCVLRIYLCETWVLMKQLVVWISNVFRANRWTQRCII